MLFLLSLHKADLLALSSALVALASFFVSYLGYRRDQGRLDVKVGIWREVTATGEMGKHFIRISAVNSGRRPVVVDSVGAFPRFQRLKRVFHRFLPRLFQPVGFFITDPLVYKELVDQKTGKYRVLTEGESIQITIPLSNGIIAKGDLANWANIHDFYVGDTTGREHRARRRMVRKFIEDLKAHIGKSSTNKEMSTEKGKQ
jgi:hypothetical protein